MVNQALLAGIAILLAAAIVAIRVVPERVATGSERLLRHRATPWVLGVITTLCFSWVAGGTLAVEPISTDEASYILQAQIFAGGHVTAPAPVIPEFFEQAWVVVTPRIYSKYPPGHALALAPGMAVGMPWLVPLLLNLVSGALLFGLLRRAVGPGAALLTWSAWVLSGMAMAWQTTYFSEVTLLTCWLGAAACGWRWLDGGRTRWLVGAGLLIGYGVITRPLSILLLTLPLAVVAVRQVRRDGRRGDLLRALAAAALVALLLPAWNLATTGQLTRSPLREYTETYIPWDRVGFAIDSTPPLRATPPDLQAIAGQLAVVHREHTIARLPHTLYERAAHVAAILFTGWRLLLLLPILLGVWRLGGPGWVIMASAGAEFFGHAIWGHQAGWTLYYAESAAAWFVPGAVGVMLLLAWGARRFRDGTSADARAGLTILLAAPLLFLLSIQDSATYRSWRAQRAGESRAFADFVRQGPPNAIYFVHYGPARSGRPGLIRNDPYLDGARAWVVYDLGPRDQELLRAAPGRIGFVVDEATHGVTPLPRVTTP